MTTDNIREKRLRDRARGEGTVDNTVKDLVKDLTGKDLDKNAAHDVLAAIPSPKGKWAGRYIRKGQKKAHAKVIERRRKARDKARGKLAADEAKLAALKARLMAGDPKAADYDKRLASCKKKVGLAFALPVVARQKWQSEVFQKQMEEKGHKYNPAKYKGHLPYEMAKHVQKEALGANSRGEYEFYIKLFDIKFLPARPDRVYEEWEGWPEFLGVYNLFGFQDVTEEERQKYRSFYDALTYVRSLRLKTMREWKAACKDGRVPLDIPLDPHHVYKDQFVDMEHWLGADNALDLVTGKVEKKDVWILYQDGRMDACWWAKMSEDKYAEFGEMEGITIHRVYEFEGHLADDVWKILDLYSDPYENDKRERYLSGPKVFGAIKSDLDNILKWRK